MNIWSESILVDKDEGWFVGAQQSALYHVNFQTQKCELLSILPSDDLFGYEKYECCNKIDRIIYIFPRHIIGNILLINLEGKLIKEIVIQNPNKADVNIVGTCFYKDKIYAMALGLRKIIVIDTKDNIIINAFQIFDDIEITDLNGKILLKGSNIYCTIPDSNIIYKLNISQFTLEKHIFNEIEEGIHTFEMVGDRFLITGKKKCFYIWDELSNTLLQNETFPEGFGRYVFDQNNQLYLDTETKYYAEGFFLKGVYINGKIWIVPCCENKIFFCDINTLILHEIQLIFEGENENTWKRNILKVKFCMSYIRQNRYIGVYSFKNNFFFEIDVESLRIEIINWSIPENDIYALNIEKMACNMKYYGLTSENEDLNLKIYLKKPDIKKNFSCINRNIGLVIYKFIEMT